MVMNNDYNERRAIMDAQPIHVSIAGRMMSKRIMGKASFSDMRDRYGRLQLYVARDATTVGEAYTRDIKKFDIGDIIGIEGEVFRTQKGEISVSVTELTLLSKNLARCRRSGTV